MKILLVSTVFMMIIAGLLALQIKTAYLYQTILMIRDAQKQQHLLESALDHGCARARNLGQPLDTLEYTLDFSRSIPGLTSYIHIERLSHEVTITAVLMQGGEKIRSGSCTLMIQEEDARSTIVTWSI